MVTLRGPMLVGGLRGEPRIMGRSGAILCAVSAHVQMAAKAHGCLSLDRFWKDPRIACEDREAPRGLSWQNVRWTAVLRHLQVVAPELESGELRGEWEQKRSLHQSV